MYEVLIDGVEGADTVSGRVGELDIPIGTVFTRVRKYIFGRFPEDVLRSIDAGIAGSVNLKLEGACSYNIKMESAPSKWSTRIKVSRRGMELIKELISQQIKHECYFLEADEV